MAGFSSTGFTKKTLEEIKSEIEAELLATVDAGLDLSADQPFGQAVAIFAQREAVVWEVVETLANAINPDAAEDFLLDALCALTGTKRERAKKSTVSVDCNVNDGFTASAGTIMLNVSGQPNTRFANKGAVGPLSPAGTYAVEFESVEYGPVVANAGTLTVITAPVSGLNSVTNPLDATLGSLREQDADLSVRREAELTAAGSGTADSLRVDLLKVDGVKQAFVFENVTTATDGNGLPPKSFEAVIYDGLTPEATNADVAEVVWKNKPDGTETYGTVTSTVTDSTGASRTVKWSRATVKAVYLDFDSVVVDPDRFPSGGVQLIKDAVVAYAQKKQNLSVDVVAVGMKSAALTVEGVIDVPTLKLGFSASPSGTANLSISGREIAAIDSSRIAVTTVNGTP